MALHRLTFHIISTLLNGSDTAIRVAKAMVGAKASYNFVFRHVCFVYRISYHNSSPGSLALSHLGNRAEISQTTPRRN